MDIQTQKEVDKTIVEICEYIRKVMKSDSASEREQLPSLIESLAKLKN